MHFIIKAKKGTYKNYIIIPSNTTLDLTGSKVKPPHFTHCLLSFGDSNNKKYNGGSNMTLIGGTFDGGTSSYIPNLCTFAHVKNVTIKGTTFKYLPKKKTKKNSHPIEVAAVKNLKILNCKFYNNSKCVPNNEAIQIESSYSSMAGSTSPDLGVRDGTPCQNVTIQKCYFKGFRYGCGSNHLHKKDHFKGMKFIGNTFVGASKYCICLYGYRNATIRGNKMKNCGSLVQNQNSTYHK